MRQIAFCIFLIVRDLWSWSADDPLFFQPRASRLALRRRLWDLITNLLALKSIPTSLRPGTNWAVAPTNPAELAKSAERRNPACILCRFSIIRRSSSSSINDYLVPFSCSLRFSLSAGLAIINSAFEHLQAPVLIAQELAPTLTHLDEPWNLKVGSPVDILLSLQYTRYTLTFCSLDEMKGY